MGLRSLYLISFILSVRRQNLTTKDGPRAERVKLYMYIPTHLKFYVIPSRLKTSK